MFFWSDIQFWPKVKNRLSVIHWMTSIVGFYEPIDVISSVLKIKIALLLLRFEVTFYTILSNMYEHHTLVECIEHNRGRGL